METIRARRVSTEGRTDFSVLETSRPMARASGLLGLMPQASTRAMPSMDSMAELALATAPSIWSTRSSMEASKIAWTSAPLSAK